MNSSSYDYYDSYPRDYMRKNYYAQNNYHLVGSPYYNNMMPIATRFFWNDTVDNHDGPSLQYYQNSSSSSSYPMRHCKSFIDSDYNVKDSFGFQNGCSNSSSSSSYLHPSYSYPVSMAHPGSVMNRNEDGKDDDDIGRNEIDNKNLHDESRKKYMDIQKDDKLEKKIPPSSTDDLSNQNHDGESTMDDNRINPHHPKKNKVVIGDSKMIKIKKRAPRNNWKKMTKEIFGQMVDYEKQHPNVKQCDLQRLFNVNRSPYWRWKKQNNMI